MIKLLQYLYFTKEKGILFRGGGEYKIDVYADAAFMAHHDLYGRSGICVLINGGVVSAHSKKQTILTKSSTESEMVSLEFAITIALDIHRKCLSFNIPCDIPMIFQDNRSVLDLIMAGKPTSLRTKHISLKYFIAHDLVKQNKITLKWCPASHMIADIFTKPLIGSAFKYICNLLCISV